jgi:hypothetical protein
LRASERFFEQIRSRSGRRIGAHGNSKSASPRFRAPSSPHGGKHSRDIAVALAISPRTVEVHKAKLMAKLGVENVADLVRMSLLADAG